MYIARNEKEGENQVLGICLSIYGHFSFLAWLLGYNSNEFGDISIFHPI